MNHQWARPLGRICNQARRVICQHTHPLQMPLVLVLVLARFRMQVRHCQARGVFSNRGLCSLTQG